MDVSIAAAKNRLPELIRAFEDGEKVVITRHGKPVVQLAPPPPERRQQARLGGMKDRIELPAGWDAPIDLDRFHTDSSRLNLTSTRNAVSYTTSRLSSGLTSDLILRHLVGTGYALDSGSPNSL